MRGRAPRGDAMAPRRPPPDRRRAARAARDLPRPRMRSNSSLRAFRVVAQRLHPVADLRPGALQLDARLGEHASWHCAPAGSRRPRSGNRYQRATRPARASRDDHGEPVLRAHLDDRAQFLREQGREHVLRVASASGRAGARCRRRRAAASPTRTSRLTVTPVRPANAISHSAGEQSAVGAVVIGEQQPVAGERLDRRRRSAPAPGFVEIGRLVAEAARTPARGSSRPAGCGRARDRSARARSRPQSVRSCGVSARARILAGRERRHDERQRRDHLLRRPRRPATSCASTANPCRPGSRRPSCGHRSSATARTVSYSAASSPG